MNSVQTNVHGIGTWGGSCTCPDGKVYQAGDNGNYCGSLACVGGVSGACNKSPGPWSRAKVVCAGQVTWVQPAGKSNGACRVRDGSGGKPAPPCFSQQIYRSAQRAFERASPFREDNSPCLSMCKL
eukprot:3475335-Pleurochrysis_carterae.AAC.2